MDVPTQKFKPPWNDAAWRAEAEAWMRQQASLHGYQIEGAIECIHERAWSTVLRATTARGHIFFKAGGPTQAFEPALLEFLNRYFPGDALPLIASDPQRGWSLMPDGGTTLRQVVQGKADFAAWNMILRRYAEMQITAARLSSELKATRVPFLPLDSLADYFRKIVGDTTLQLVADDEDHLTPDEFRRLHNLPYTVSQMFVELDSFGIPLSLEHGDLHDANVFVSEGTFQIYDWGDTAYTHPFFTLLLPIRHMADKLNVSEYDAHPELLALRDVYFEPWLRGFERSKLLAAWDLAHHLAKFARTINWYRVTTQIDASEEHSASVSGWLKEFLAHPTGRF